MNIYQKFESTIKAVPNPTELSDVLLEFFGKREGNVQFEKYSSEENLSFIMEWNSKHSKITRMTLSRNFPNDELNRLIGSIENGLIKNQNESIGQSICFSSNKVIGSFKYRDVFEILPVPSSAPQLPFTQGKHPFILKFKYITSDNGLINSQRAESKTIELIRILNVLLMDRISGKNRYATQTWGRSTKSDINSGSVWFNEGYSYPASLKLNENNEYLNEIDNIELFDDDQYYNYFSYLHYSKPLTLPQRFESIMDIVFSLSPKDYSKFYKACSWIEIADMTRHISYSSSLIALISALESFMEQPTSCKKCGQLIAATIKDGTICPDCSQPILKLTSRFKQLFDIDNLDVSFNNEKEILYSFRSKLVHGDRLFLADLNPNLFPDDSISETSLHLKLGYVCRRVILNWVQKRK